MNAASLYQRVNNMQRQDARCVLQDYNKTLQWRSGGGDRILDVGSGSGNVLMDLLYPLLPPNFGQLIGSDISEKMVDYANKQYASYERTKFKVLDISTDELPTEFRGQFDHVTSFYCLHWVLDQRKALRNIYNALNRNGGDCLLVFLVKHPLFVVYQMMYEMPKWQPYMRDVDKFISPLFHSPDPVEEYGELLQEAGFVDYSVELRDEGFVYENLEDVKDNLRAVNPFLERIPPEDHDDFMNDLMQVIYTMNLHEHSEADVKFKTQYKYAVVYARRAEGFLPKRITASEGRGLN